LRPDVLEAEADAVGTILLTEDTLTRVQKGFRVHTKHLSRSDEGMHSPGGLGSKP
jgi:hypothetical protein